MLIIIARQSWQLRVLSDMELQVKVNFPVIFRNCVVLPTVVLNEWLNAGIGTLYYFRVNVFLNS